MAQLSAIYANALFDLAVESASPNEYLEQAVFLRETLGEAGCKSIIMHPQISAAEKAAFLQKAFAGQIHDSLLGFMRLTIDKNREVFLLPALSIFIEKLRTREKQATAYVRAAKELDAAQTAKLKEMLEKKLGKQIDIQVDIDPAVIGGFSVFVDGFLIDRTVKKQLQDMKTSIKRSMAHDS